MMVFVVHHEGHDVAVPCRAFGAGERMYVGVLSATVTVQGAPAASGEVYLPAFR